MLPVFRPLGWKAGTSQIDQVIHQLLIAIVGIRFVHITLYIIRWTPHSEQSSDNAKKP